MSLKYSIFGYVYKCLFFFKLFTMRDKLVAANWKMNKTLDQVEDFLSNFNVSQALSGQGVSVLICSPSLYLQKITEFYKAKGIFTGSQDVSMFEKGAYTGEISASMLASVGVSHCIVGHSERRKYHAETDSMIAGKVSMLLSQSLIPVFCCGELLEQRQGGYHFDIVREQLLKGLFHLNDRQILHAVVAYEPVWAIGTGVNATEDQAQEMHAFIRSLIKENYGNKVADSVQILYGGSCNSSNAASLFACPDVDGGLVGGASLQADEFLKIIEAAHV